jgi:drug/metabolite transporter (DMT)-like permease
MTAEQHNRDWSISGAGMALVSALLFGITTPLAKALLTGGHPLLIAGLLYAGSGLGLTLLILAQDRGRFSLGLARSDRPWLAATVVFGGVLGPAWLMFGLAHAEAAATSLLLNLEAVFTALMAWIWFREATSRRVVWGFVLIFVGSVAAEE